MIHQFDHKIKKQFEQTEIAPSDALWQKIEASLPVEKNRKIIILPWYSSPIFKQAIAASVMFLLGGASMYYLLNESPQGATNTTAQNIQNLNTKTPENTLKKEVAFTGKIINS